MPHAVFRHTPLGCHSPTLSGSPPPQSRVERRSSQASHYQPLEKAQTQQQVSYGSFSPPKRTPPARCRMSNVHSQSQYQNRINFSKVSLLHMVLPSEFAKKVGHAWGHNQNSQETTCLVWYAGSKHQRLRHPQDTAPLRRKLSPQEQEQAAVGARS